MRAIVSGGWFGFGISIPRPDGTLMIIEIPRDIFYTSKAEVEKNPRYNRMFLYPMGDFKKLAFKDRPIGTVPSDKARCNITFTPQGVVISIIDYTEDKEARCMPIPYEVFTNLDGSTKYVEIELKY